MMKKILMVSLVLALMSSLALAHTHVGKQYYYTGGVEVHDYYIFWEPRYISEKVIVCDEILPSSTEYLPIGKSMFLPCPSWMGC
jgi:hypothetical protein